MRGISRRGFIKGCAASGLLLGGCKDGDAPGGETPATAAGSPPAVKKPAATDGRLVVLGFDGVDPRLVEKMLSAGLLPNLQKLAREGGFSPLGSTSPPNSPVAWSTFATGKDPTEHGVFGFLRRTPKSYLPGTAPYTITGPRFGAEKGYTPPSAVSRRQGPDFWNVLDGAGVPQSLLFVPYAFPPPGLKHGRVFAGLGAPDLRFTNSSFTRFTTEPARAGDKDRVAGGRIVRLASFLGSAIETALEGVRGPDKGYLAAPLRLELNQDRSALTIELGGGKQTLPAGRRSQWFPVRFEARGAPPLLGRVRFHVIALKNELELYASPIQIDPASPALSLGGPGAWLREAAAVHGGLPTVGWVHDTSAVNASALPPELFLADLLDTMDGRAELLARELDAGASRLVVSVFTGTDRVAHMFYRDTAKPDLGALGRVYARMDRIVGDTRKRLKQGTKLIVLSDHGFHAFDRMLHVNTWLEAGGWFKRSAKGAEVKFLRGVDWQKTRAYALGNGQVYVNLVGREGQGSVAPDRREAVLAAIEAKLLEVKDPKTGAKPVRAVYRVAENAAAGLQDRAPDLQIAFAPGYRSSWETSLGGAPVGGFLADNPKVWCGDHAASDRPETPGILLSDAGLAVKDPDLKDLSATILTYFGARAEGAGRKLF